jgi:hypothetical protein
MTRSRLTFTTTETAGVYGIVSGGRQELVAVNPITEGESDLTAPATTAGEGGNAATTESVVSRRELVTPWLLLCLAMVTAEWWLRVRKGRQA